VFEAAGPFTNDPGVDYDITFSRYGEVSVDVPEIEEQ
jgi:hypothetical protein